MTKVTTRNYLNGECIEEIVTSYIGDEIVSEVTTEFDHDFQKPKAKPRARAQAQAKRGAPYTKQTPESIAKMLATRAAKKAKMEAQK